MAVKRWVKVCRNGVIVRRRLSQEMAALLRGGAVVSATAYLIGGNVVVKG